MLRLIFILVVCCSFLSQTPQFIEEKISDYLKFVWIIPMLFLPFINHNKKVNLKLLPFIVFPISFLLYCLIMDSTSVKTYIGDDAKNVAISFVVFFVSYSFKKQFNNSKKLTYLWYSMIAMTLVLMYSVYIYAPDLLELNTRFYAFEAKNSMSTIMFATSYIIFENLKNNKVQNAIRWVFTITVTIFVFILRSRATIICYLVILLFYLIKSKNNKLRFLVFAICTIGISYIFINKDAYDTIITGIILAHRDVNDLNEVSSNRLDIIEDALPLIPQNIFFGVGNTYVDCMPIAMVLQFGIFGATIIFLYIWWIFKQRKRFNMSVSFYRTCYLLFYCFIVNSFFEAQPPFGPGIKCFLLWMCLGFSFYDVYNKQDESKNITAEERLKYLYRKNKINQIILSDT